MAFQETGLVLSDAFTNLWFGIVSFIPNLVIALVILIAGWIIGALVGKVIEQIFTGAKVDIALRRTGVDETLSKAGIVLNSGKFVGGLVKWFVVVAFLIASFDVLRLSQVNEFLKGVVIGYLPQVIAAVLILLVAVVIGDAVAKLVRSSAKAAELKGANLLGAVSKWVIWVVGALAALDQLGIGQAVLQTLFTGIVVALSLAFGLSFGLGGQAAASSAIEKIKREIADKQ
ncbi:MAG: hypothetical protein QG585_542 [Patescibacteria group bacterium]|jgi:hypothetical protein|nr:hypothetical protein [Patescibacteria group bacterium]